MLAGFVQDAAESGLRQLSDDELIGFLCAARRLSSWQAAMEFTAVAELDARRRAQATAPASSRASEHVSEELAAALTLTARSADALLSLARELARLPAVLAALAAGRIDRGRAAVFAGELGVLGDVAAAAVSAAFGAEAARMTTGQLRAALRRMVLAIDPDAARRRAERGRADARVEGWLEDSGNGALSGRELPAAEMIAADKRIDAIARALKSAGAPGSLDQLRAAVFTALLTGRDPRSLAPYSQARQAGQDVQRAGQDLQPHGQDPQPHGQDLQPHGQPGMCSAGPEARPTGEGRPADQDARPAEQPDPRAVGRPGCPPPGCGADDSGQDPARGSGHEASLASGLSGESAGDTSWASNLGGSVNLTMPLATWLGMSDAPGEAAGIGPLDAATCRELASHLAAANRARWCVTLTDQASHAVAHACARVGPGPPGAAWLGPAQAADLPGVVLPVRPDQAGRTGQIPRGVQGTEWLAALRFAWLELGECSHRRQTPGYRPGAELRHLIQVRQRTCCFPGCRYPARRCDLDHTVPWDQGGRTCECGMASLCRRHHRAKQTPGWQLAQPEPGTLTWVMPGGRSYGVQPGSYPA